MADGFPPEILAGFVAEVRVYLSELEPLLAAEAGAASADHPADIERGYRLLHMIRGAAEMLDLGAVEGAAAGGEALLAGARQGGVLDAADLDSLRATVDGIARALDDLDTGGDLGGPGDPGDDWADEALAAAAAEIADPTAGEPPAPRPLPFLDDEAGAVPADLIEGFLQEADEHLSAVGAALRDLARDPADGAALGEARRRIHTLKGAAGMIGFPEVARLSHALEDTLDRQSGERSAMPAERLALVHEVVDVLEDLVRHPRDPKPAGAVAPLLARLADALPGQTAGDGGDGADALDRPAAETERRPAAASQVRLPFERIDSLVRLASELLVERSTLEQAHRDLQRQTGELTFTLRRLRGLVDRLESGAEAAALLGVGTTRTSAAGAAAAGGLPGSGLAAGELAGEEFDALEMDRYTELHVLARGLAEVVSDAETAGAELTVTASDLDGVLVRQRRLVRDLQDGLLRLRTVPLATLAGRLHRTARVAAERSGKQVELTFEGEAVELDKGLLEAITDSFLHLVRNAVAHGIEPPAVRRALGKPERGQVRVTGRIRGGLAVLTIEDDGAGIDVAAVRSAAVVRGLLSPEAAESLTDDEARTLVFLPGFSTAATVSEIAGRGVGLDVVQSKVESLRGVLALDSAPGRGTRVTLRLPLVLTVLRCLFVRVAGQPFALPAAAVLRVERIERSDLRFPDAGRGSENGSEEPILVSLGEPLPVRALADVLGLPAGETIDRPLALVVDCGEHRAVFLADQLLESREVVVKPLGPLLGRVAGLAGATLLGDGTVVPILDPAALPNPAERAAAAPPAAPGAGVGALDSGPLQVLIVDDSLSVRRVLSNLALKAGWIPHTARDGREALEALQQLPRVPDAILLDIEMPRMDGFELAATLRALPTFARVPIILLTSRSGTKHRDKALGLGVSEYLVKPFDPPVLLGLVERLTAARRRAGAA